MKCVVDHRKLLPPLFILPSLTLSKDKTIAAFPFYTLFLLQLIFGVSQIILVLVHGSTCPSVATSMVLSGILFTISSISVFLTGHLLQQSERDRNLFLVTLVVVCGYALSILAPSASVATATLFCYYMANQLCQVKGAPNPGLIVAVEPLVASLLCAAFVFIVIFHAIQKFLVGRGHLQDDCCSNCCCTRLDQCLDSTSSFSSSSSTATTSSASVWTRLTGGGVGGGRTNSSPLSSPGAAARRRRRRRRCGSLFCWSVVVAIFAWLIVSGWLGLLPGQWTCLPLKPSGCKPFVVPPSTTTTTTTTTAPAPSYKLALWHEGFPIQTDGSNSKVFAQYVTSLVNFCIDWKFSRCFLQIFNPKSTTTKPNTAFAPELVAKYFVQPLLAAKIEAGFVAYARSKDTGWNREAPLLDISKYVKLVEAKLVPSSSSSRDSAPGHVCCLAFDHEDLGGLDVSNKVKSLKKSGEMWSDMQVGYAGGASLLSAPPSMDEGVTDLYPELYWYGELAPGHETKGFFVCSTDCVTAMPCFSSSCVTTPYRKYVNQPRELLDTVVMPHLAQQGLAGNKGLFSGSLSRSSGRTIWSMFSFEHLAGCCPERAYGPGNSCGTFDGLSLWNKASVLELFESFALAAGFNATTPMPIAVYEFQFIPPHLIDPSLSATPVLVESDSSAVPLACDGT